MWPPDLTALKTDLRSRGETVDDLDADDDQLEQSLDAAVSWVQRVRRELFERDTETGELLTPVELTVHGEAAEGATLVLGTLRLAGRWDVRRRSPDGMVQMGQEMGSTRVASFDPDIDKLLRIGRFGKPVVG